MFKTLSAQKTKTIRFGHSPDPDDAFMFYAIAKNKIRTHNFQIDHVVEDIESLNQRALKGELEATAVSVHAFAYLADKYAIMRAGASVGDKYGPIIVSKKPMRGAGIRHAVSLLRGKTVAIPGLLTTANLVLKLFMPKVTTAVIPFDQILGQVSKGKVDAGVVIHEGQLTYADQKLHKIVDLGEGWYQETGLPLPLGIDVVRRDLGARTMKQVACVFKESICYGLKDRKNALRYAIQFGRGLKADLNDRFVGMYVNDYTIDLGKKGERAMRLIYRKAAKAGIIPGKVDLTFV